MAQAVRQTGPTTTSKNVIRTEEKSSRVSSSAEFARLKSELIRKKEAWSDPDFPADSKSILSQGASKFDWKRPREISDHAAFMTKGGNEDELVSRFDVKQGNLGNSWFLSVVSSLAMHKDMFTRVVPLDQDFNENYCGAFHFRFWQFGKWVDVVVDDRLPTLGNKLLFAHSSDVNEFWPALLEKAYAKLCGSYEALSFGVQSEAMEDFTGGITETISFKIPSNKSQKTYEHLLHNEKKGCLIGATIDPGVVNIVGDTTHGSLVDGELEEPIMLNGQHCGLYKARSYSITALRKIKHDGREVGLIRIRDPAGGKEWNGAWSDNSREWKSISDSDKRQLNLNFAADGEFWMSFDDFVNHFNQVELCHLGPESISADSLTGSNKRTWEESVQYGSWRKDVSAGGCRNFHESFYKNPQYRVTVTDADENDSENLGTLIVALMQTDQRLKRLPYNAIGYSIYAVRGQSSEHLSRNFFSANIAMVNSDFVANREVVGKHRLPPGNYVIIPSTYDRHVEGDFVLRILSERPVVQVNGFDSKK